MLELIVLFLFRELISMDHYVTPAFLLVVGILYKLFPPKKPNLLYGWRTPMGGKNQDTWEESNRYGANLFIIASIAIFITTFILKSLFPNINSILLTFIFVPFLITVIVVGEIHLSKTFNQDGSRRNKEQ